MNDNLMKDRTPIEQIADMLLEAHAIARTSDYRVLQTAIQIALLESARLLGDGKDVFETHNHPPGRSNTGIG